MIKEFADGLTEQVWRSQRSPKGFPNQILAVAYRKLLLLDKASQLSDLELPAGNELHPLKGDREGQYAIRVNDQFRLCFKWRDGHAYAVEIVDYH